MSGAPLTVTNQRSQVTHDTFNAACKSGMSAAVMFRQDPAAWWSDSPGAVWNPCGITIEDLAKITPKMPSIQRCIAVE
jgi:hypothetical protein